jgi:hypothetical protein
MRVCAPAEQRARGDNRPRMRRPRERGERAPAARSSATPRASAGKHCTGPLTVASASAGRGAISSLGWKSSRRISPIDVDEAFVRVAEALSVGRRTHAWHRRNDHRLPRLRISGAPGKCKRNRCPSLCGAFVAIQGRAAYPVPGTRSPGCGPRASPRRCPSH